MGIIFLNGCTSAGKTSIARALQGLPGSARLCFGIDDGFALLPPDHHDGYWFDRDERGLVRLNYGTLGFQALAAYRRAAVAIAATGIELVVDEVLLEPEFADDWIALAEGHDVFTVGVHCDLAELERREILRGDRRIGQARGQIDLVHRWLAYAFEIDTTRLTPVAAAEIIAAAYAQRTARGALSHRR